MGFNIEDLILKIFFGLHGFSNSLLQPVCYDEIDLPE